MNFQIYEDKLNEKRLQFRLQFNLELALKASRTQQCLMFMLHNSELSESTILSLQKLFTPFFRAAISRIVS